MKYLIALFCTAIIMSPELLHDIHPYRIYYKPKEIPKCILNALERGKEFHDVREKIIMGKPNCQIRQSHIITKYNKKYLLHSLIYFIQGKDYSILYYKHGGMSIHNHLVFFDNSNNCNIYKSFYIDNSDLSVDQAIDFEKKQYTRTINEY